MPTLTSEPLEVVSGEAGGGWAVPLYPWTPGTDSPYLFRCAMFRCSGVRCCASKGNAWMGVGGDRFRSAGDEIRSRRDIESDMGIERVIEGAGWCPRLGDIENEGRWAIESDRLGKADDAPS